MNCDICVYAMIVEEGKSNWTIYIHTFVFGLRQICLHFLSALSSYQVDLLCCIWIAGKSSNRKEHLHLCQNIVQIELEFLKYYVKLLYITI